MADSLWGFFWAMVSWSILLVVIYRMEKKTKKEMREYWQGKDNDR